VTPANVTFYPGASEDYAAAYCWYYDRGPTLAANFESEVERGVRLISQNPSRWPKFDNRRRRFIVRKFPYSIIDELNDGEVIILAVAHGKRRPNYWQKRSST
jgi:plasmid stabilization system protein ParE